MPETFADMSFPYAGMSVIMAFGRQPAQQVREQKWAKTTPLGINVRAYAPGSNRMKGGSRPGLARFISARVNGTALVQGINTLVSTAYSAPGGGSLQSSQSGRVVTLVAVSGGTVKVANAGATSYSSVTSGTTALNTSGVVFSAPNNQKLYFADGVHWKLYNPATNAVETWAATRGTLPVDSENNKPRLICTWRGRTVLAGLLKSPQELFMSAVRDPTDFDYDGQLVDGVLTVTANQAWRGTLGTSGDTGDVINALIPFNDDVLIVGMDHTIRVLRGDPMAGGDLGLVSDGIGMAWGEAWCKDPFGNIYFMSNHPQVFRLTPSQPPIPVSQQIDELLRTVNTGTNTVRLSWDHQLQGVHVFITPTAAAAETTHYFWEARTNAWWQDIFGNNNHNPLCCCTFDGNRPEDRVVLIGSWDGYVRFFSNDAETDDYTDIESEVLIGPLNSKTLDELLMKDLVGVFATESNPVTYEVLIGNSAQEALDSDPVETGTWGPGRNDALPVRRSGHAVYVRISATKRWAMESIRGRLAATGKVRARSR